MDLWYLYQSGFALRTEQHLLIFDYYRDEPQGGTLADGVLSPSDLAGQDVVVLVSHQHSDHYNPVIFSWQKAPVKRIRYLLSDDIPPHPGALQAGPGQTLDLGDLTVRTLLSNDEGVAFLLTVDGHTIYHAGDLNWWHWDGESDEYNADMGARYTSQIDLLRGLSIDLAFLPVDPRLERTYAFGIDYFMRTVGTRIAIPMHFADHPEVIPRLLADPVSEPYRDRVLSITHRGQHWRLP